MEGDRVSSNHLGHVTSRYTLINGKIRTLINGRTFPLMQSAACPCAVRASSVRFNMTRSDGFEGSARNKEKNLIQNEINKNGERKRQAIGDCIARYLKPFFFFPAVASSRARVLLV